jgi:hypothetical protein
MYNTIKCPQAEGDSDEAFVDLEQAANISVSFLIFEDCPTNWIGAGSH